VKKFTNGKVAVARIWEAVQVLLANVVKPLAHVAPSKGKRNKDAPKSKRRHTAPAPAKEAVNISREGSKKLEVIDLMRRSHRGSHDEDDPERRHPVERARDGGGIEGQFGNGAAHWEETQTATAPRRVVPVQQRSTARS